MQENNEVIVKKKNLNKFQAANIVYFIIIACFILFRLGFAAGLFSFMGKTADYVVSLLLQVGLMLILPIFLYSKLIKKKPKATLENFGIKKIKLSAVGISILIGIVVFILNIGIASFFNFVLALLGYERTPSASVAPENYTIWLLLLNLVFTAILPGICEEVTHRGMLVDGYSKLGYKKAILFSAILFGLTHLNINQFFYATIIGILLGFMTMATGNIIPAMIVHFMNNAINVFLDYAITVNKNFAKAYNSVFQSIYEGNFFVTILTLFVIISALFLLLAVLVFALFKRTAVAELNELAEEEAKKQLRAQLMEEETQVLKPKFSDVPFQVLKGGKLINVYISSKTLRHPIKQLYFPKLKEKAFFYASFAMAIFVTISTFIWGTL